MAEWLGLPRTQLSLRSVEAMLWSDACLGVSVPGRVCAELPSEGLRVVLADVFDGEHAVHLGPGNVAEWVGAVTAEEVVTAADPARGQLTIMSDGVALALRAAPGTRREPNGDEAASVGDRVWVAYDVAPDGREQPVLAWLVVLAAGRPVSSREHEPRIVEVKRRLDGSADRFECELVEHTRWRVMVCFRIPPTQFFGRAMERFDSYGLFWRRRPYNCYYIVRPDSGALVLARFDVVRDVELDVPGEVSYSDLLLDLSVRRGVALWEDEDELAEAIAAGLLSDADRVRIERSRAVLERGHRRIAAEVRRLLMGLGRLP